MQTFTSLGLSLPTIPGPQFPNPVQVPLCGAQGHGFGTQSGEPVIWLSLEAWVNRFPWSRGPGHLDLSSSVLEVTSIGTLGTGLGTAVPSCPVWAAEEGGSCCQC
jgi:hypothetical protein